MGKKVSPTLVGAFVLGALGLAVVAVVALGSGQLFRRTYTYVLFFNSNVNGLRVGAPVKFRGVEIGSVKAVLLGLPGMRDGKNQQLSKLRIPVLIQLDPDKIGDDSPIAYMGRPSGIKRAVAEGLRGQLQTQSFVTGLLYVDLDMYPNTPVKYFLGSRSPYPEIPTVPTTLERAQVTLEKLFTQLEKIDFHALIASMTNTANAINQFTRSPKLQQGLDALSQAAVNLNRASVSIRKVSAEISTQAGPIASDLRATSKSASAALNQMQSTLKSVQVSIQPGSPLNYQLIQTLHQLSSAARAMRELADFLQRNPSAVVRGKSYSGSGQ